MGMKLTGYLSADLQSTGNHADDIRRIARTEDLQQDIIQLVVTINRLNERLKNLEEKYNGND